MSYQTLKIQSGTCHNI